MSASHDGNNAGQASQQILCANNCGFFGNPLTGNLCSKCSKERKMKEDAKLADAAKVAAAVAPAVVQVDAMDTSSPSPSPVVPTAAPQATATPMEGVTEAPKAEVQADATKCWSCQRKVGLLGFKCKCTYVFCSKHRYADQHTCTFDYKSAAKEQIKKANPVVEGAKVVKI